ncbi:5144_t:CDS:2, partial [Acaulospora colombiana]
AFVDEAPPEVPVNAKTGPPPLPPNKPENDSSSIAPIIPGTSQDKEKKNLFNSLKNNWRYPTYSRNRDKFEDKNVQQAIDACRPEARNLLHNRQHMDQIKEALNEGYCDVSGMEGDLAFIDDAQLRSKDPTRALISWFFTLAHEIAVSDPIATHISSTHLLSLVDELQNAQFGITQIDQGIYEPSRKSGSESRYWGTEREIRYQNRMEGVVFNGFESYPIVLARHTLHRVHQSDNVVSETFQFTRSNRSDESDASIETDNNRVLNRCIVSPSDTGYHHWAALGASLNRWMMLGGKVSSSALVVYEGEVVQKLAHGETRSIPAKGLFVPRIYGKGGK